MSLLGAVIAGGAAGGAGSVQKTIQVQREKALRQLENDAEAARQESRHRHETGLLGTEIEARENAATVANERATDMNETNMNFESEENERDREEEARLQRERLTDQGWRIGQLEDGTVAYYNPKTQETRTAEGFTVPSSGGNGLAFTSTPSGFYLEDLQKRRDSLYERMTSGTLTEEEMGDIKVSITAIDDEIDKALGRNSGGTGSVGTDVADSLFGEGNPNLEEGWSVRQPPPSPGGGTGTPPPEPVALTPEESEQRIREQNAATEAAEAEEFAVEESNQERRFALTTVNSMLDEVATSNNRPVAVQTLFDARQKLFEIWNSRDDWTDKELEVLSEQHEMLINYEKQYDVPK